MCVSVIVPAYNCAPYIGEALQSILSQGSKILEVIVVDDGSSDATAEVVRAFGPPVRLLQQTNAGPAAARNRALREARGEFLAFLDADDVWLPGKIDAQLDYLHAHPDVRFVFGRISYWLPDQQGCYSRPPEEEAKPVGDVELDKQASGWIYPALLLDSAVCIIAVLMHRTVYETVGEFDVSMPTGEDYDYWLRASRHFEMHKLARYMARYRLREGGTTRHARPEANELMVLQRALARYGYVGPDGHEVSASAVRARIGKLWFDHGHLHFWHGDVSIASAAFAKAIRARPTAAKAYGYWALSALRNAGRKMMTVATP